VRVYDNSHKKERAPQKNDTDTNAKQTVFKYHNNSEKKTNSAIAVIE
jgi:hypothetical protein